MHDTLGWLHGRARQGRVLAPGGHAADDGVVASVRCDVLDPRDACDGKYNIMITEQNILKFP